jgi:hypothetical protein
MRHEVLRDLLISVVLALATVVVASALFAYKSGGVKENPRIHWDASQGPRR